MSRAPRVRMRDLSPELQAVAKAQDEAAAKLLRYQFEELCLNNGVPRPRWEYQFHPTRKWRLDLAWHFYRIGLEIEGALFGMGKPCPTCGQRDRRKGHTSVSDLKRDMEKYNAAAVLGWRILRTTPENLLKLATIELVRASLSPDRSLTAPGA